MKKLFSIVFTLILAFSSFGITVPQKVSANTSLAGTYYISAVYSGKVLTSGKWKFRYNDYTTR